MTPWSALMRQAAVQFGLTPGGFWALSVREWRLLVQSEPPGLGRSTLEQLIHLYPDDAHAQPPDA